MAKVLLVEDDNNLREIYQARLMAEGYDIVAAQNGEEALVLAKQNKPDLIISDVMMPRISGFEMLDILRNTDELKNTKVIMLTALGQAEDQTRADNLGADKYLVKSQVTLEDIVNAAKELVGDGSPAPVAAANDTPAADASAAPTITQPEEITAPLAPASLPVVSEPAAVGAPATPADMTATAGPAPTDDTSDNAVPASVVPQSDTTVVVPPAPANPTPPAVTVAPLVPHDDASEVTATPQPSTPAAPEPVPAVSSSPTVEPAAPTTDSQPMKDEEAAVKSQIDDFAAQPAPAVPTAEVTAEAANNDQAIANAVKELNDSTPATDAAGATPSQPPAEEPAAAAADPTPSVGGTKVIQPLSNDFKSPGPDLNELLAKEEAKDQATPTPTPSALPAPPTPPAQTPPAASSSSAVDPGSIAL